MVHKLGQDYKTLPPMPVIWNPSNDVKYPASPMHPFKWKIYAQEDILIPGSSPEVASELRSNPGNSRKTISLKFGVKLYAGVVLISLVQILKNSKCSIQNESVAEPINDIIITVQNNTTNDVKLNAGEVLCYLTYVKV